MRNGTCSPERAGGEHAMCATLGLVVIQDWCSLLGTIQDTQNNTFRAVLNVDRIEN